MYLLDMGGNKYFSVVEYYYDKGFSSGEMYDF